MSATMIMFEVITDVKYVGNPIMDIFNDYFNRSKKDNVEKMLAEQYGYDLNNHSYKDWLMAYNDVVNHAYIDESTGQFISVAEPNEFGFSQFSVFDLGVYRGDLKGRKARPMLRQLKKLRDLGVVQKHRFDSTGTYEYIPVKVVRFDGHQVYRSGWFFDTKWLESEMPILICTSYDDLRKSLDRVIDVKSGDADMNKRGVEAYQYFLMAFKKLTEQNPDKKYFVKIAF